jgi:hypothetical protein
MESKIVEHYKEYVGEKELDILLKRFNIKTFCDKWNQVITSRSTSFLGSGGSEYSSVTAKYSLTNDNKVTVFNECYDEKKQYKSITGTSDCFDSSVPTCRTVLFPSVGATGNYWILYISEKNDVMIICCPLIIPHTSIKLMDNFALYVLAKDRNKFWSNKQMVQKIYTILEKYKFNNFINKPIYSGV